MHIFIFLYIISSRWRLSFSPVVVSIIISINIDEIWNALRANVVSASSVDSFRRQLKLFCSSDPSAKSPFRQHFGDGVSGCSVILLVRPTPFQQKPLCQLLRCTDGRRPHSHWKRPQRLQQVTTTATASMPQIPLEWRWTIPWHAIQSFWLNKMMMMILLYRCYFGGLFSSLD